MQRRSLPQVKEVQGSILLFAPSYEFSFPPFHPLLKATLFRIVRPEGSSSGRQVHAGADPARGNCWITFICLPSGSNIRIRICICICGALAFAFTFLLQLLGRAITSQHNIQQKRHRGPLFLGLTNVCCFRSVQPANERDIRGIQSPSVAGLGAVQQLAELEMPCDIH